MKSLVESKIRLLDDPFRGKEILPKLVDLPCDALGGLSPRQFMNMNLPPFETTIEVAPGVTLADLRSGRVPYPSLKETDF